MTRPPHALNPIAVLAVFVGGVVGTAWRYGLAEVLPTSPGSWPMATLTVNLVGAFGLGVLLALLAELGPDAGRHRLVRLAVGTGFFGSLTTYSSLAVEVLRTAQAGHLGLAAGYAALSVAAGLAAAAVGMIVGVRAGRLSGFATESAEHEG